MAVPSKKIWIDEKVFAGNAIIASLWTYENKSAIFTVNDESSDTEIYRGIVYSYTGWANADISGIFKNKHITASSGSYSVSLVSVSTGNIYATESFSVYAGGINKLLIRHLLTINNAGNIFDYKIKNQNTNFLLTTRTFDTLISIPEDELLPLYYYSQGLKFKVMCNDLEILSRDHSLDANEAVASIDFSALREMVVSSQNRWASEFKIETETGWSFTVLITECQLQHDYQLKFLNSFGVYEKIALSGDVDNAPEFETEDMISEFDELISDFVSKNQRKKLTDKYVARIDSVNTSRRTFIRDMILSDCVLFIIDGREYSCNINTSSGTTLASTNNEPTTLEIEISLTDLDQYFSPSMPDIQYVQDERTYLTLSGDRITMNNSLITI